MRFISAILPQIEVLTLSCVNGIGGRYGRIRLWGSIGYILLTIATGTMIESTSHGKRPVYITVNFTDLIVEYLFLTEPINSRALCQKDSFAQIKGAYFYLVLFFQLCCYK